MQRLMRFFTPILAILLLLGCTPGKSSSSGSESRISERESGHRSRSDDSDVLVDQELIDLYLDAPEDGVPGVMHPLKLTVMPDEDVGQVTIHAYLSDDVDYERSEPPAHVQGRHLTWHFQRMHAGDTKDLEVWVRPRTEGNHIHCATVEALPLGCVTTFIGQPRLKLTKEGPERAILGSRIHYQVMVENTGTLVARNVVVTDQVPAGLEDPAGRDSIEMDVGELGPGQSRSFDVELIAARRGRSCNLATVDSSNANKASDEVCTLIVEPRATLTKTGPSKSWVGKTATYQITVNNPGDTTLTDVQVRDRAPMGTTIVDAPGAAITGDTANWNVAQLAPNASRSFNITLRGDQPGELCNEASLNASDGVSANATFCTNWQGHAAILVEVVDTEDPLLVGGTTTYRVTVRNQGTAPDHNVFIVAQFPPGLIPTDAHGRTEGTVRDRLVRFASYPQLEPSEAIEFFIRARAISTGDHHVKVELFSDLLQRPVTESESTHVY